LKHRLAFGHLQTEAAGPVDQPVVAPAQQHQVVE
jgi:hypothetical protein